MRAKTILCSVISIGLLILIAVLIFILVRNNKQDEFRCPYCLNSTSNLGELCSSSEISTYRKYAVSTDSNVCANAGKAILDEDGNAIDAAISVLLCMGVTIPESLGLGGGSLIVIYNGTTNKAKFINAREMAPGASYRDMFNKSGVDPDASHFGLQSIAVPGELAGYWHMFENYGSGKIKWERLFHDAIKFAEDGFPVGQHLNDAMEQYRDRIEKLHHLSQIYINPLTKDLYKTGDILKQPELAETLRNISKSQNPHEYFYHDLAQIIINDLKHHNDFDGQPIITLEDFEKYEVIEKEAFEASLDNNITLYTSQLPGSGVLLSFMMRVMLNPKYKNLYPDAKNEFDKAVLFYHRLMETFKFAYAARMHLGDDNKKLGPGNYDDCAEILDKLQSQDFIDEVISKINDSTTYTSQSGHYDFETSEYSNLDHGTAHMAVLDKYGNAVSVSTTVNLYFGSKVISPSTGLILNDEMNDFNIGKTNEFGVPVSFANTVAPFKRPMSSMSPSVFVDDTGPRLVIGASGGTKITTAVALTSLRNLWMGDNIKLSIDSARLHHQLYPGNVENEQCFPEDILKELRARNHQVKQLQRGVRGAVVMAISRSRDGIIQANSDFRKGGTIAGE